MPVVAVELTLDHFVKLCTQQIAFLTEIGPEDAMISIFVRHPTDRGKIIIISTDTEFTEVVARAFGDPATMTTALLDTSSGEYGEETPLDLKKPS